ncbi:TylF/MycF/NovP-related O-methyltransferase [Roseimaritima sediminicola]|uniref:TylF/MycF/NovP-related O-methyltransferase n=1 Tax=Roseimaritima sediminicola TaxID=2662066 RepID=UPI0012983F87|nr:TylF/MycF/NovP-related O-methyltransferase [Roseimaritima sediminicola]
MKSFFKTGTKKIFASLLYRHRPIGLSAGKLYLYLDAIYQTRDVPGDVVEVGCNLCGTSVLGYQMIRKLGLERTYQCVDTFGGFVNSQYSKDVELGNSMNKRDSFSANSIDLARKVLDIHNAEDIELIRADIVSMEEQRLPYKIAVSLLDVDLYEPILSGLEKIYPRLASGGRILVDDCGRADGWQAGKAVRAYCEKNVIDFRIEFGMAVIDKPLA